MTLIYEPKFCETSYGFRPGRSAHDALRKCREYLNTGKLWTVDMDLEKFFDTVNQSKLMETLSRDIKLGIDHNVAYMTANRRRAYWWYMSNTPAMETALSNNRLEKAGFVSFWSCCKSVSA